jgi:thiaminase
MAEQTLTQHLLAHSPSAFKHATQSPFLSLAGSGTLSKTLLSEWLGQDRLYAQAYIRFASLLLANIPLPQTVDAGDVNER